MADEEHLAILRQDVKAWNQWRKRNPDIQPDLSGADLTLADLSGTDLSMANLSGADLTMANLSGADLSMATLSGADLSMVNLIRTHLSRADLSGANLGWAMLSGGNLGGADLHGANLTSADLSRADLSKANLSGVDLYMADLRGINVESADVAYTTFGNVDLSEVKGLETVRHYGPSTIGIDTIYNSKGKIPEVFLKGCGVPDQFIAYIGSLVGKAIEYHSCFISYSSKNQDFAEQLHNDLQAKGVRCWFAPEDLKIGDRFRPKIDEAIRLHDKLLLILSEHSVSSDWVVSEVEAALEKERQRKQTVLFPVRLDDVIWRTDQAWAADIRRTRHIGDFSCWKDHDAYQKAFDRLLRDLKAESAEASE